MTKLITKAKQFLYIIWWKGKKGLCQDGLGIKWRDIRCLSPLVILIHHLLKQKLHIRANDKVGSALVKITIVDKKVPVDFLASLSYQDVSGWQHLQAPGLANSHR